VRLLTKVKRGLVKFITLPYRLVVWWQRIHETKGLTEPMLSETYSHTVTQIDVLERLEQQIRVEFTASIDPRDASQQAQLAGSIRDIGQHSVRSAASLVLLYSQAFDYATMIPLVPLAEGIQVREVAVILHFFSVRTQSRPGIRFQDAMINVMYQSHPLAIRYLQRVFREQLLTIGFSRSDCVVIEREAPLLWALPIIQRVWSEVLLASRQPTAKLPVTPRK